VFRLLLAELLDRLEVGALEEAALDDIGVEGRLQVLEREGVVEDADVALAVSSLLDIAVLVVVVLSLSLPQAARNAAAAAEPPVSAMNLRRETGSFAARAIALCAGASAFSRSMLSGMSSPRWGFELLPVPYASLSAGGSQSPDRGRSR